MKFKSVFILNNTISHDYYRITFKIAIFSSIFDIFESKYSFSVFISVRNESEQFINFLITMRTSLGLLTTFFLGELLRDLNCFGVSKTLIFFVFIFDTLVESFDAGIFGVLIATDSLLSIIELQNWANDSTMSLSSVLSFSFVDKWDWLWFCILGVSYLKEQLFFFVQRSSWLFEKLEISLSLSFA